MFEDYKQCIEFNKQALKLKKSGQEQNQSNIGLAYFELQDYNEAINALILAL